MVFIIKFFLIDLNISLKTFLICLISLRAAGILKLKSYWLKIWKAVSVRNGARFKNKLMGVMVYF
jgi:hypothetical protein